MRDRTQTDSWVFQLIDNRITQHAQGAAVLVVQSSFINGALK